MRTHLLLAALAVIGLLAPITASAYLTPEQQIEQTQYQYFFPQSQSDLEQLYLEQQRRAQERHQSILKDYPAEAAASSAPAAGPAAPLKPSAEPEETVEIRVDAATLRLLKRLELRGGEQANILHSGAPLAPTGPEGPLTVLVMAGSILWTLQRARKMERRLSSSR